MFKGKGRWLTTLLVAVGAAVAVQGEATAHAATTDTVAANPETVKPADGDMVAAKTAPSVKLTTAPKVATTDSQDDQVAKPAATTTSTATAKPTVDADASNKTTAETAGTAAGTTTKPADQSASKPAATPASAEVEQPAKSTAVTQEQDQVLDNTEPTQNISVRTDSATKAAQQTDGIGMANATESTVATPEQNGSNVTEDATAKTTSSITETTATVTPQFKTAVDAVQATPTDALTWTTVSLPGTINLSRNISLNGKNYIFAMKTGTNGAQTWGYPLFNNSVQPVGDSQTHTYAYQTGNSDTSDYYKRDLNKGENDYEPIAYPDNGTANVIKTYETATADDGTPYIRMITQDGNSQLTVTETLSIDASGTFDHVVSVQNDSSSALNKVKFGTMLDTMLDTDDQIPIVSNGDGSVNISSKSANTTSASSANYLTLYLTPTSNDTVNVGEWKSPKDTAAGGVHIEMLNKQPASGVANGTVMENKVDTAIQYETPALSLAPGASTTYCRTSDYSGGQMSH